MTHALDTVESRRGREFIPRANRIEKARLKRAKSCREDLRLLVLRCWPAMVCPRAEKRPIDRHKMDFVPDVVQHSQHI